MHVLRHSAAMRLLQAGVDKSVIALWLGHEQIETTQIYLHADLQIKERALERTALIMAKPGRFRPTNSSPPRSPLIMPTPSQRSPPETVAYKPTSA
jgi:integrase/recombinase XerD